MKKEMNVRFFIIIAILLVAGLIIFLRVNFKDDKGLQLAPSDQPATPTKCEEIPMVDKWCVLGAPVKGDWQKDLESAKLDAMQKCRSTYGIGVKLNEQAQKCIRGQKDENDINKQKCMFSSWVTFRNNPPCFFGSDIEKPLDSCRVTTCTQRSVSSNPSTTGSDIYPYTDETFVIGPNGQKIPTGQTSTGKTSNPTEDDGKAKCEASYIYDINTYSCTTPKIKGDAMVALQASPTPSPSASAWPSPTSTGIA